MRTFQGKKIENTNPEYQHHYVAFVPLPSTKDHSEVCLSLKNDVRMRHNGWADIRKKGILVKMLKPCRGTRGKTVALDHFVLEMQSLDILRSLTGFEHHDDWIPDVTCMTFANSSLSGRGCIETADTIHERRIAAEDKREIKEGLLVVRKSRKEPESSGYLLHGNELDDVMIHLEGIGMLEDEVSCTESQKHYTPPQSSCSSSITANAKLAPSRACNDKPLDPGRASSGRCISSDFDANSTWAQLVTPQGHKYRIEANLISKINAFFARDSSDLTGSGIGRVQWYLRTISDQINFMPGDVLSSGKPTLTLIEADFRRVSASDPHKLTKELLSIRLLTMPHHPFDANNQIAVKASAFLSLDDTDLSKYFVLI